MRLVRRLAPALALLALAGTAHAARGVTVKGSDTTVILMQRWAEQYMNTHPGAIVQVTGGGSGTGRSATSRCASDARRLR